MYKDDPSKNIIMEGTYFGKNVDAFFDCLKSYFFEVNEYAIEVYISSCPKLIDSKGFYIFMLSLMATRRYFPDFNFNVFLSKEVFDFYFDLTFEIMTASLLPPSPFDEEGVIMA